MITLYLVFGIVANYHGSLDVMDFYCKILFFMIYNDCTSVYKQKRYFESKILLKTLWSHQSICTRWNNLKKLKVKLYPLYRQCFASMALQIGIK